MIKKGLIAGVAVLVVSMLVSSGFSYFFPALAQEYKNPSLFRPWTDPLMMLFFAYPFIFGIVSAYLWNLVGKTFKGDRVSKAYQFMVLYFIIATIPGMFISYTTFPISFMMIASWTVSGLVSAFVAGYVFVKLK